MGFSNALNASTPEFLKRLRKFVQAEADAQYRALERQWSRPLQERVARGWAIEGLRVEQMKDGVIRLSCVTNDSRFREGDLVLLHRDNPHDPDALHRDNTRKLYMAATRAGQRMVLTYSGGLLEVLRPALEMKSLLKRQPRDKCFCRGGNVEAILWNPKSSKVMYNDNV